MEKFDFSATLAEAEKKYNLGRGEYFKLKEGQNKLRLVSVCLPHAGEYKGQKTFKWLCQVIDRKDNQVKPFFMPVTIYKGIEALQMSEDFNFVSVPMPYDIIINAKGAGTKEVVYSVLPTKEKALTENELMSINEAPTVQELQTRIFENQVKNEELEIGKEETLDNIEVAPFEDTSAQKELNVGQIPL